MTTQHNEPAGDQTWEHVAEEGWRLHQAGAYAAEYELLTRARSLAPTPFLFWMLRLSAAVNVSPALALRTLEEAIDEGYWFDAQRLQSDDTLRPLVGLPAFEQVLTRSGEVRAAAQRAAQPVLRIVAPETGRPPYPVVLALHGNNASIASSLASWQPAVEAGWLVALAQSSQVGEPDAFVWRSLEQGTAELKQHYAHLRAEQPIDGERIVLAGFSMGAGVAVASAVAQDVPARAFIAVAPYLADVEAVAAQINAGAAERLRGYIVVGAADPASGAVAQRMTEVIAPRGIRCEVDVVANMGHFYPPDFPQRLKRILAVINP